MNNHHSLEVQSLACERGERLLFSCLDFTVQAGQGLHVVGANGSGKTSLLRILATLGTADDGHILWNGQDVAQTRPVYAAAFCFVGHQSGVNKQLSPRENCAFLLRLRNRNCSLTEIDAALDQVELLGFEDEITATLSAGQQRRIALAQLLLSDTPLWLLDEPYTALDKIGIDILNGLFTQHLNNNGLLVFASHQESILDQYSHISKVHLQT